MIAGTLTRLLTPGPLSPAETRRVLDELLEPTDGDVERVAILVALAGRPLEAAELVAFARELRRRARPFPLPPGDRPVDLCGSGGARVPSFNVSTVAAFVVAAAGVPVVKHGNRSARGPCGSSDLLEALGLPVTASTTLAEATYRRRRVAFLHAPLYHPTTGAVREARRAIGIPTIFNRLGPLSSPAAVPFQVAGAPDQGIARVFAASLARLGVRRGLSMASDDGCDEFSPRALTRAWTWTGLRPQRLRIRPEATLRGTERRGPWGPLPPKQAASEAERVLRGGHGARRGSVLLTGGAALWITGRAGTFRDGVEAARGTLDAGAAYDLLEELRDVARQVGPGAP